MKVWVTSGALLRGVVTMEDVETHPAYPGDILHSGKVWIKAGDWHTSEEAARVRVAVMVEQRLIVLDRWRQELMVIRDGLARGELPLATK